MAKWRPQLPATGRNLYIQRQSYECFTRLNSLKRRKAIVYLEISCQPYVFARPRYSVGGSPRLQHWDCNCPFCENFLSRTVDEDLVHTLCIRVRLPWGNGTLQCNGDHLVRFDTSALFYLWYGGRIPSFITSVLTMSERSMSLVRGM